jgi:hypothetical protein
LDAWTFSVDGSGTHNVTLAPVLEVKYGARPAAVLTSAFPSSLSSANAESY